jgi:hypothetical protein
VFSFLQVSPQRPYIPRSSSSYLLHALTVSFFCDFLTRTKFSEQCRSLSSTLYSFHHSPVTSSLLGSNILLNTLFSSTLSLLSSLNVSDQVLHPYKKQTYTHIYKYIHRYIYPHTHTYTAYIRTYIHA